uniref:Uncharacterized protein n=1 Tax=Glossina pallidipes TaxID=7398 RepID=A0A1B0AJ19_GLOPL
MDMESGDDVKCDELADDRVSLNLLDNFAHVYAAMPSSGTISLLSSAATNAVAFTDWAAGWLAGWLPACLPACLPAWLAGWLVDNSRTEELEQLLRLRTRSETLPSESSEKLEKLQASD